MSCLLINLLLWLTRPIAAIVHSLPATEPAWNSVLTGVLSIRSSLLIVGLLTSITERCLACIGLPRTNRLSHVLR